MEDLYFLYAFNGHNDNEKHIAELVEPFRQGHRDRKRARSVAQSVEYHLNNTFFSGNPLESCIGG